MAGTCLVNLIHSACLLLVFVTGAAGAHTPQYRLQVHPHPTLAITSITEDRQGIVWLATTTGLFTFDGRHFRLVPNFPFPHARYVATAADGSIWAGGAGGLARYRNGFEVISTRKVDGFTLTSRYAAVAFENATEILDLNTGRTTASLKPFARSELTADASGRLWFICDLQFACVYTPGAADPNTGTVVKAVDLRQRYRQAVAAADSVLWATDHERASSFPASPAALPGLTRSSKLPFRTYNLLVPGNDGRLWFLGDSVQEFSRKVSLRSVDDLQYPATAGWQDSSGRFWVARYGLGLQEWIPAGVWESWSVSELSDQQPRMTLADDPANVVLLTRSALHKLEASTRKWRTVHRLDFFVFDAAETPERGYLVSGSASSQGRLALLDAAARLRDLLPKEIRPGEVSQVEPGPDGRIWVGGDSGLRVFEPGTYRLTTAGIPEALLSEDIVDLRRDRSGTLWAATPSRISRMANGNWDSLPRLAFPSPIRDISPGSEDIWISWRKSGFSRLFQSKSTWQLQNYEAPATEGATLARVIFRDSRGWIWRASAEGLHVSDGVHLDARSWLTLPGGAIGAPTVKAFSESADGTIWVTGERGVLHIEPDPGWFRAALHSVGIPVTSASADGVTASYPALPVSFPKEIRRLTLTVGSTRNSRLRDYPFRYRLQPRSTEWELSRNGQLEFENLTAGQYALELQETSSDAGEPVSYRFHVGSVSVIPWPSLTGGAALAAMFAGLALALKWPQRIAWQVRKSWFLVRLRQHQGDGDDGVFPGHTLANRYDLLRRIARGGAGTVYEARDREAPSVPTAIKILRSPAGLTEAQKIRSQFNQETSALQALRHPGVVSVNHWWVEASGEMCLAMPLLQGRLLREVLRDGPIPATGAADLIQKLGNTLAAIHRRGLVHRDVKPENIMLTKSGPVLFDFGSSVWHAEGAQPGVTATLTGSLGYIAPEQLRGQYSSASDTYALAVVSFEMLTGCGLEGPSPHATGKDLCRYLETKLSSAAGLENAARVAEHLMFALALNPDERAPWADAWSGELAAMLTFPDRT